MEKDEFEIKLLEFINHKLIGSANIRITETAKLFEKRLINSMKIIELIAFVEKKLKIKVNDDMVTMENFESVRIIADKFINYGKKRKSK